MATCWAISGRCRYETEDSKAKIGGKDQKVKKAGAGC